MGCFCISFGRKPCTQLRLVPRSCRFSGASFVLTLYRTLFNSLKRYSSPEHFRRNLQLFDREKKASTVLFRCENEGVKTKKDSRGSKSSPCRAGSSQLSSLNTAERRRLPEYRLPSYPTGGSVKLGRQVCVAGALVAWHVCAAWLEVFLLWRDFYKHYLSIHGAT